LLAVAVVSVMSLLTFLAYHQIVHYFFTGMDSLTLIETGRFGSMSDVARVVTRPLMAGTDFTRVLMYYRPLTSLSYGFDYLIWGLNPLGYHAVDLGLHVVVCVLVFFVTLELSGGSRLAAWLSALLFAAHPINVEVVPVVANRQDVLASVFLMSSLVGFLMYRSAKRGGRGLLYLSFVFYVLALASKELAVLLPCLILAYAFIFARDASLSRRVIGAIKAVAGYAILTAAWFGWRAYVLGGVGGYVGGTAGVAPAARSISRDAMSYFVDLFYPLLNIASRSVPTQVVLGVCVVFAASVAVSALWTASAAWAGTRSAPTVSVKRASGVKGSGRTAGAKGAGGESGRLGRADTLSTASGAPLGGSRPVAWLAVWLVVPLLVSLWTGTLSHRNMYFPAIALCILISLIIVRSMRFFYGPLRDRGSLARTAPAGLKAVNAFALAFALLAAVSLFGFSPVIHGCSDWQAASNAASLLLKHLDGYTPSFKDGTRLEFKDLPSRVSLNKYRGDKNRLWFYQAREMSILSLWSLNSWLKLTHPEKNLEAAVLSRAEIRYMPVKVELEISRSSDADAVRIRPVYYVMME
jgi:hypothetical protein